MPDRNLWFSSFVMRRLLAQAHQAGDSAVVRERLTTLVESGCAPSEATLTLENEVASLASPRARS